MSLSESKVLEELLKNYFHEYGISNIQKESFEELVHRRLSEIINEECKIEILINKRESYIVTFEDVTLDKPCIIEEDRTTR